MAEDIMVGLSTSVLIPLLFIHFGIHVSKQEKFRKRVDEKMHTHAADGSINGIRGWY